MYYNHSYVCNEHLFRGIVAYMFLKETIYVQSKKDTKDQETIQSSTTLDPGYHMGKWESNKNIIDITSKSQEVSPFPAGDLKAAMIRRESMRNTRHKRQK